MCLGEYRQALHDEEDPDSNLGYGVEIEFYSKSLQIDYCSIFGNYDLD